MNKKRIMVCAIVAAVLCIITGFTFLSAGKKDENVKNFVYNVQEGQAVINGLSSEGLNMTEVTVPSKIEKNEVTSISSSAFYCNYIMQKITIPKNVKDIGMMAFWNCSALTTVEADGVENVADSAFKECMVLEKVSLKGAVNVAAYAFYSCANLTEVEFSESLESIGSNAFYGCRNLTIIAPSGSFAEQYAQDNGINFQSSDK